MKNILLLACLLTLSTTAHAADTLDHGSFTRSCAPWDGAAVRFELTGAAGQYPQIGFSLFTGEDAVKTGSYSVPLPSHDGNANYCTSMTGCQLLKSGSIELEEFSPWTAAKIRYDVFLDDGTELKGEASLSGTDTQALCG